jgi:serine phosphatase RsbU (regulator of sigma subunit)
MSSEDLTNNLIPKADQTVLCTTLVVSNALKPVNHTALVNSQVLCLNYSVFLTSVAQSGYIYNLVIFDSAGLHDSIEAIRQISKFGYYICMCGNTGFEADYAKHFKNSFVLSELFNPNSLYFIINKATIYANEKTVKEITATQQKLEMQNIMMAELEQTNQNLISATWRERDMKKQLRDAMDEIEKSKAIIEHQNFRIAESINYSKNIQTAINIQESDLLALFPESFILYKPKDVISGDFPWLYKDDHNVYLAAVDCTGHGVPGAMMSMLGNLLLNDIIRRLNDPSPAQILDELHKAVVKTLKQDQTGSNSHDGMDIALLKINQDKKEIYFASAHRPLFYFSNNQFNKLAGDKFPVGGIQYDKKRTPFTNTQINYQAGDSFYIFSDGLPDQLGGPERRKFNVSQITELVEEVRALPMSDICQVFDTKITDWTITYKQIDDILLIGFKG